MDIRPQHPDSLDLNYRWAMRWEIYATWDLSRIFFDDRQPQIAIRSSQLTRDRHQLLRWVIELYFERCRLINLSALMDEKEPLEELNRQMKLSRITATLNALTGGLISMESAPR
jgi:hypothetical protein